jgi:ABC-type glycerol-3-phosphate transport system substrate-binding protein
MMQKTSFVVAAAAYFASSLMGARAEEVTLQFLFPSGNNGLEAAVAEFQKRNPDIKIQYQPIPFAQMNSQVLSRLGTQDSSLDIYGVDAPRVAALVQRKFLSDFSALRSDALAAFGEKPVETATIDAKMWALPMWNSTQLLYFNKDLLKAASLSEPEPDPEKRLTWDRLLDSAAKAKAAGAKWGFVYDQVDRYYQLQPLFESNGAGPGLTGPDMLTPTVASPKWVETAAWYGKLFADALSPRGVEPAQSAALFASGQAVFFYGVPAHTSTFVKATDLKFGIAPVPYFKGGIPVTATDSWMIGISPYSKHAEQALKFVKFITLDPEGSAMAAGAQMPANKISFQQYADRNTVAGGVATAPFATILSYELTHTAVSRPHSVGYVAFEEIMNKTFSDIRNGADAAAALAKADLALKAAFARIK